MPRRGPAALLAAAAAAVLLLAGPATAAVTGSYCAAPGESGEAAPPSRRLACYRGSDGEQATCAGLPLPFCGDLELPAEQGGVLCAAHMTEHFACPRALDASRQRFQLRVIRPDGAYPAAVADECSAAQEGVRCIAPALVQA